jgi:hypothetical protein
MNPALDPRAYDDDPFAAIDRLATLQRGWDSYDAEPIAPDALEGAKRLLHALDGAHKKPLIGPTPAGVELIWRSKLAEIHAIVSNLHEGNYVVLDRDRHVIDRGHITDYGFFARNVLKTQLRTF